MKNFLLVFLIFLISTSYPQQNKAKIIQDYYSQGLTAYKEKNYSKFLECFEILDSLRSNNTTIMYNLACAYSLNHKKDEAIKYLKKYISIRADENIEKDNDFSYLKNTDGFKELLVKIKELNKPINTSNTAFIIDEKDLHPESIAYDEKTETFYLGSIHKRKIISSDNNGNTKIFIPEKQDGLFAVNGIKINSKERVLWTACTAIPQMIDYNKSLKGICAVFKYNLDSKKLLNRYFAPKDSNRHYFGDLALNKNGDVYVSDSYYPAIYLIKNNSNELELFYKNNDLGSLQGLDFSSDGKYLFFADYSSGVYKLDINSKKLTHITEPKDCTTKGIDGLYFYNNSLIAIQNGVLPNRVTRYFLSDNLDFITNYKILERANPNFNEPTLGVIVNNNLYYIANSQWNSYNKDGSIFPMDKLEKIIILKTELED